MKLPRDFYARPCLDVARALVGKHLVHRAKGARRVRSGRIVEVEAYVHEEDQACHARFGRTPRASLLFGPPGHAYVYLIYGMYHCMNVVTQPEGKASAVLLRALEPVAHIEGRTQGPGLLCRSMEIDRRLNGHDLTSDDFYIADDGAHRAVSIVKRPRVGVEYAGYHWSRRLLRFYVRGNPYVSKR